MKAWLTSPLACLLWFILVQKRTLGDMGLNRETTEKEVKNDRKHATRAVNSDVGSVDTEWESGDKYMDAMGDENRQETERRRGNCDEKEEGDDDVCERVFPAPSSHVAALNRELKALETRYFRTRSLLSKTTEKNDELRREMTQMTRHATKQARQMATMQQMMDRFQSEHKLLVDEAKTNRAAAIKLEHQLVRRKKKEGTKDSHLSVDHLTSQLEFLTATVKKHENNVTKSLQERDEARGKLRILERVLEKRLEAYELNGSLQTGLLYQLATQEDEKDSLIQQIAALMTALEKCQTRTHHALQAQQVAITTLNDERVVFDTHLAQRTSEIDTAAAEKATLLTYIQEQATVQVTLQAQKQRVEEHFKALQVTATQESTRLSKTIQELHERNESLQTALTQVQRDHQKTQDALIAAKKQADETRRAFSVEIDQLESNNCNFLTKLASKEAEIDQLESKSCDFLTNLTTKEAENNALRQAMESALDDLKTLSQQCNQAIEAKNEVLRVNASLDKKYGHLQTQLEQQKEEEQAAQGQQNDDMWTVCQPLPPLSGPTPAPLPLSSYLSLSSLSKTKNDEDDDDDDRMNAHLAALLTLANE